MNDIQQVFAVSFSGLQAERKRLEVVSANLAHASTAHPVGKPGFDAQRAVVRAAAAGFDSLLDEGLQLPFVEVQSQGRSPRIVHEPSHPFADAEGMVAYANVDTASEMVELMTAIRSYEANLAVVNATRSMALKALEIGGQG